jgi:transposase
MSDTRTKYDEEFKKNAVQLSYASPKPVREIAADLGITEGLLYRWRKKYTKDGDKTKFATLEEEARELRRQLAEARIEVDMLRKATAYFASLHKNGTHS